MNIAKRHNFKKEERNMKKYTGTENINWNGFTLQPGFWYGEVNGKCMASSGWRVDNAVCVYFLIGNEWKYEWIPFDEMNILEKDETLLGREFIEYLREEQEKEEDEEREFREFLEELHK